jgi:hypothetical protein
MDKRELAMHEIARICCVSNEVAWLAFVSVEKVLSGKFVHTMPPVQTPAAFVEEESPKRSVAIEEPKTGYRLINVTDSGRGSEQAGG